MTVKHVEIETIYVIEWGSWYDGPYMRKGEGRFPPANRPEKILPPSPPNFLAAEQLEM